MTYINQYESFRLPHVPVVEITIARPGISPRPLTLKAIVDSGADYTVIPLEVIEELELPPWGVKEVRDFAGESRRVPVYTARITISTLKEHLVRTIGITGNIALAGRNILNYYKVTLDGPNKKIEIG